jgi:hypothetical protein
VVTFNVHDDDPTLEEQLQDIATTTDGFSEMILDRNNHKTLVDMRRKNGEADDPSFAQEQQSFIYPICSGNGAIGISNFGILDDSQKGILDRFRNVFIVSAVQIPAHLKVQQPHF